MRTTKSVLCVLTLTLAVFGFARAQEPLDGRHRTFNDSSTKADSSAVSGARGPAGLGMRSALSAKVVEDGFVTDLVVWAISPGQEEVELAKCSVFDRMNARKGWEWRVCTEEK